MSTVPVSSSSKVVGERWSRIVAFESYFEGGLYPQAMLKVGTKCQVGDVEIQDL